MAVISDDAFVRLFQATFGLESDGFAGGDTMAKSGGAGRRRCAGRAAR